MRIRTFPLLFTIAFLLLPGLLRAAGIPTIRLTASRMAVLNNGRDTTEIIAEVRDSGGQFVPDGTTVNFTTNLGNFAQAGTTATAGTRAGSARIRLSSPQKGMAMVQAVTSGGGFATVEVTFTDDPADTFQGNTYLSAQATGALLYSAGDRVIEASGRKQDAGSEGEDSSLPGAFISFRNIEVFADSLQVDCTSNTLRAWGRVRVRRGGQRLECARLYLPLMGGDGFAIAEIERRLRPVKVKGSDLSVAPVEDGIPPRYFEMTDLSEASLVVTAQQILLFPGDKLQFKRPQFYQEGQKLFSMPFYSLGLYSTQLFTDQFLSVGTQGIGVDLPFYYDMTPASTGVFRVRHGERAGRSVYATRPGWSLDLTQAYNSVGGSRFTGALDLTGVNRSDWGIRWNHSQEFTPDTRGSFFLDLPQHRNLFASANLGQQFNAFHMGLNLSANRSLSGFSASGHEADLYLETIPRKVGNTGYMMAVGGTASLSRTITAGYKQNMASQGVQARFFSRAFRLDRDTTLMNYVTFGQMWTNRGRSGMSALASLTATRTFRGGTNLQLTYDFTQQPGLLLDTGRHRVSMNLFAGNAGRWSLFTYGSTFLDAPQSSLVGDVSYAFAPRWRVSLAATLQRFATADYKDFQLGIARSLGGRDLLFSYSTLSHRFFFDLEASRF